MNCDKHDHDCGCQHTHGSEPHDHDLSREEPGSVWYGVVSEPEPGVDFLIREKSAEISANADCTGLSVRAGSVEIGGVLVGLVLFRFNDTGRVYLTAWDCLHPADEHENPSAVLSNPAKLGFRFVGDSGEVEQVFIFESALASFFRHLRQRANGALSWSEEQFSEALAKIYSQFSSAEELWQKFSE